MNLKMIVNTLVAAFLSLCYTTSAGKSPQEDSMLSRVLKKSSGGGSFSSGSGGSFSSGSGGSSSNGSGGSFSGGTVSGGSRYSLNGGLGNKYSTSTTGTSNGGYSARGSCCKNECCSSGIRTGYSPWWYRGYRPTRNEEIEFQEDFSDVESALRALTLFNETGSIFTDACAFVYENGVLVEREEASLVARNTGETLGENLDSLANRIDILESHFDVETDVSDDLRKWFLDFHALQPCLETLSSASDAHDLAVLEARQEVEEVELTVTAWEARLASTGSRASHTMSIITLFAATLSVLFV